MQPTKTVTVMKTQPEIVQKGYQILVGSLGVTDTLRFIQYFSPGQGDYTRSRQATLDQTSLEDILATMRHTPVESPKQYDEIIE